MSIFNPLKPISIYQILCLLFLIMAETNSSMAEQNRSADMNDDGRVDPKDAYYLQHQWQMQEKGADLNGDDFVGEEDLLELESQWHESKTIENPYTLGRAVGIYAVSEYAEEQHTGPEMELEIIAAEDQSKIKTSPIKEIPKKKLLLQKNPKSTSILPNSTSSIASNIPLLMEDIGEYLSSCNTTSSSRISSDTPEFGVQYDQIGTFWGESIWIGWGASFSDSYSPDGESYCWVIYFAPEAVYVALQKSEYVYSSVDVNAGINTFWGVLNPPGGEYLTKQYVESLNAVTLSRSLSTNLITGLPGLAPVPSFSFSTDVTFYRVSGIDILNRGIQFGTGVSVSFSLLPVGNFALPFSVSLDYSPCQLDPGEPACGVYAGFYPILIWDLNPDAGGNPMDEIKNGLEQLAGESLDLGATIYKILGKRFAERLIPFIEHLQAPVPVTLEDGTQPPTNGHYFTEFLQNASTQFPSSSPDTSIDYLIKQVEEWLQSGETSQLPDAINKGFNFDDELLMEYEKHLQGATQIGFNMGYYRGCDASSTCERVYANCIKQVHCAPGNWCTLVVEATEAAELFPSATAEDFEGVWVRFERDPMDYLNLDGEAYAWAQFENGLAIHEFVMNSNAPVSIAVFIHQNYNPIDSSKHIELCLREVIPDTQVTLCSNTKAIEGYPVPLKCKVQDENGIPITETATVKFYDDRDYLIGAPVKTTNSLAELEFIPKPSIPYINEFTTTLIGYTEQDSRTGYALYGRGISVDANVTINGTSVNDLSGWAWQINSSKEILFLPPDDSALLTETSQIQVVNPKDISSNLFEYQP